MIYLPVLVTEWVQASKTLTIGVPVFAICVSPVFAICEKQIHGLICASADSVVHRVSNFYISSQCLALEVNQVSDQNEAKPKLLLLNSASL